MESVLNIHWKDWHWNWNSNTLATWCEELTHLGRPRRMVWGGRREEGSGWGTHVYLWWIHFDIWQNQYNIVKLKNKKKTLNWKKKKTRLWCWERLKAGGEGMKEWTEDEMVGWDHWLNGHEFWVNSGRWWWTGRPGMLQSMGSQRFGHDWVTELFTVLHTQILEALMFHSSTVYSWLKVPIPLVIAFLEIVLWVQVFWERHNLLKRYRKELKP